MKCICKICNVEFIPEGKSIRLYCSNSCKFKDIEYNQKRISKTKNQENIKLKCKICGWESSDVLNKSGILKKHLRSHNIDFNKSLIQTQFDTLSVSPVNYLNCPLCEWKTSDINNSSGCFTSHLKNKHGKTVNEFLEDHSEYNNIWKIHMLNYNRKKYLDESNENFIECNVCNEKLKILSNTHLSKHNLTTDEYKSKYNCEIISNSTRKQYTEKLSNVRPTYVSSGEKEVLDYIKSIGEFDIIQNNKKIIPPFELDIFLKDKSIGIEFNGVYWHSELHGGRNKHYHLNKLQKAEENDIRLIQIFDDEWDNKQDIIKSKLSVLLGANNNERIYARECDIVSVDKKTKSNFLNDNHLQGNDKSNIIFGLKHNDRLICIITFNSLRISLGNKEKKKDVFELVRYCVDKKYNCLGGFSKLLKHFIKNHNPKSIITYADKRFSSKHNNVYKSCGFELVGETKPNYFYTLNHTKRLHRYNFTKNKLIKKLGIDEYNNKTEWEIMQSLGYDRIWDCGHLKYTLNIH